MQMVNRWSPVFRLLGAGKVSMERKTLSRRRKLRRREVWTAGAKGRAIVRCQEGCVWLTGRAGKDVVLIAGEVFSFADGPVVIEGLSDSVVEVRC